MENGIVSIKHWHTDDQPRCKLLQMGVEALTDAELLSILINSGTREKTAVDVSKSLLNEVGNNLSELAKKSCFDLMRIEGIGESKATLLIAALELGRRRHASKATDLPTVKSSSDVAEFLKTMLQDYNHEVFGVLFLNRANRIMRFEIVSKGGISGTVCDPRIVLRLAIDHQASAIILTHNHPSGNLKPSRADEELTSKIKSAASFLDVKVLDHIIVSQEGVYSFADDGIL